jgi:acyl-ACP thioesterase
MRNTPGAVDLLARPSDGDARTRVSVLPTSVRLGDVDSKGRLRLDATARLLQDAATDDASDAGLDRRFGWLVRRTLIDTVRPATLGEDVEVATWCTGIGRSWAERRSQIVGGRGALIDAVSLWVQIDIASGRPARIDNDFLRAYESTARGRVVSARLALDAPEDLIESNRIDGAPIERTAWVVRRTDIDPFGHVNNAATWEFLEEFGALDRTDERTGRAELEYLQPVEHGRSSEAVVRGHASGSGLDAWLVQDGSVCAAARWTPSMQADRTPG